MTTLVEEKRSYTITDAAGQLVAGRPHDGVGSTVELTPTEARYELLLGTIVPEGVPVVVPPPVGPVSAIDRIAAIRGARDWDFTVDDLVQYLGQSTLVDVLRATVVAGAGSDRDTLAKLSAALDTIEAVLRASIATRASSAALAGKATIGGLVGPDADYALRPDAVHVVVRRLTASRTWFLPNVGDYPQGQDLVIVDEGRYFGDGPTLTVCPLPYSGDTIPPYANNQIVLDSAGICLRLRRGLLSDVWVVV